MTSGTATGTGGHRLGDITTSEQLIKDLYLDLRRQTRKWALITGQTAQARMGYIGQHLVSVATGHRGAKSGARGHDLIHPDGTAGEIKTCYRVDQLGQCGDCEARSAPGEDECSDCGSKNLVRKDDSKWLISIRNEAEYIDLFTPSMYYLVLFEFTDLRKPDSIKASIWTASPRTPGFVLCMIDYYQNTRAKSKSKAPFNLWPYSLKFELMRPELIYQSIIGADDTIDTLVFPGRDLPRPHPLSAMIAHMGTKVSTQTWRAIAEALKGPRTGDRRGDLQFIDEVRSSGASANSDLCDLIARQYYGPLLKEHLGKLPPPIEAAARAALD